MTGFESSVGTFRNGLAGAVADLTAELAALHADRARRRLIDLATGILVDQLALSPPAAGDHLVRLAASTGLSTVDFAADVVDGASGATAAERAPSPHEPSPSDARRIRRAVHSAAVSDTATGAAAGLLEGGLRHRGAQAVYLWRLMASDCLQLAGHAGAEPQEVRHWHWVVPEAAGPLHRILLGGVPVWFPRGPGVAGRLPGPAPDAARALVPLRRDDRPTGIALVVWPAPAPLDEPTRATVTALCRSAGHLLDGSEAGPDLPPHLAAVLAQLDQPAVVVRTDDDSGTGGPRDGPEHVVDHLNPAALRALGPLPAPAGRPVVQLYPAVHAELSGLVASACATGATQYAPLLPRPRAPAGAPAGAGTAVMAQVRVVPLGHGRAAVLWHTGGAGTSPVTGAIDRLERLATFEDDHADGSRWGPAAYEIFGLAPGVPPVPLRHLGKRLHQEDGPRLDALLTALAERHTGGEILVRVYRAEGGMRHVRISVEPVLAGGVLAGVAGVYQDVSAQHRTEPALTATFDRLSAAADEAAVRNALVLQLQHAIVPEAPALVRAPGLSVAARYRPAVAEHRVGGDWYDVQALPDGTVLVTVGDIAGHGIGAATAMIALRGALHGLAFTGSPPGRLMAWLNEVTLHAADRPTATAVCALFDPSDHCLRWSSAGHLPPLLLRGGRARFLDGPPNLLCGAEAGRTYAETVTRLRPGDTLLLYTDGFVERRNSGLDEGLAALGRAAEALPPGPVEQQADHLMAEVIGDTDDDTSLVVVQVA
ncbi:SpoIIE family protein phosphatase [Streptomyces sp. WAC06614]|uniref:SpoIIE family protein phosphatase n=1 Tax=Streptomyces sp. WAC06614 TaxID=2487416 RepID=UPI000F78B300|nr:SpoIIE family protein phosphatase [Streptomyces sp. WAC06614]RSS78475.1 ANTAR domain-containing protein [Streptomyces sp. WAC06614]